MAAAAMFSQIAIMRERYARRSRSAERCCMSSTIIVAISRRLAPCRHEIGWIHFHRWIILTVFGFCRRDGDRGRNTHWAERLLSRRRARGCSQPDGANVGFCESTSALGTRRSAIVPQARCNQCVFRPSWTLVSRIVITYSCARAYMGNIRPIHIGDTDSDGKHRPITEVTPNRDR